MSEKFEFDLEFRPNYFGPADLEKHFGARVKGELRRKTSMDKETLPDDFRQRIVDRALEAPELSPCAGG